MSHPSHRSIHTCDRLPSPQKEATMSRIASHRIFCRWGEGVGKGKGR